MAIKLEEGQSLVHYKTVGERDDKGNFVRSIPLYAIVSDGDLVENTRMTPAEVEACQRIVNGMHEKFKQYVDGVKALELQRAAGKEVDTS